LDRYLADLTDSQIGIMQANGSLSNNLLNISETGFF